MNDFTKEELEAIADRLEGTLYKELLKKVQDMIENFCDHELCQIDYDHHPIRCKTCKEIVE